MNSGRTLLPKEEDLSARSMGKMKPRTEHVFGGSNRQGLLILQVHVRDCQGKFEQCVPEEKYLLNRHACPLSVLLTQPHKTKHQISVDFYLPG